MRSKAFNCPSCCELLKKIEDSLFLCSHCRYYYLIVELTLQEGKKLCNALDNLEFDDNSQKTGRQV